MFQTGNSMMKKLIYFIVVFSIILFFSINGCKKDCPGDAPPDDSIPDTTDTLGCNPAYHYLTSNELSFYNFLLQSDSIIYYKTNSSIYLFHRPGILLDTTGDCSNYYEYYSSAFLTSINISRIDYRINSFVEVYSPENFLIRIGPTGQLGCQSIFKISTGMDTVNLDSIQLLDKTFYNIYYRTVAPTYCCTEMYYNKQYGVVGFNWLGDWYVLETDSL